MKKMNQFAIDLDEANLMYLERVLNYSNKNKQVGHLQEVMVALTFNGSAKRSGSQRYRMTVNPNPNSIGGRDLLLFDICSGDVIQTFESKFSKSRQHIIHNFRRHTNNPNSPKYYPPGTVVVTNKDHCQTLQQVYPHYQFTSCIPVPGTSHATSLKLSERTSHLFEKMGRLQPGEKFTLRGSDKGDGCSRITISKGADGTVSILR